MKYVVIDDQTFEIDSDDGLEDAEGALGATELDETPVWICPQQTLEEAIAAEFDGAYATAQRLFRI